MYETLICVFCGGTAARDEAPELGWAPSFWRGDTEYCNVGQAVCPVCVRIHLTFDEESGDYEIRPGHPVPAWVLPLTPRLPFLPPGHPAGELLAGPEAGPSTPGPLRIVPHDSEPDHTALSQAPEKDC